MRNLMADGQERVTVIDLEAFRFDHPEWDLRVTAVQHHGLGRQTGEQCTAFVPAAGRDRYDWHGYETPRALKGFAMTVWLMQNGQEDQVAADEYRRLLVGLHNGSPCNWHPR
ncbi:hypothetical protein ACQ4WX_03505 [Streptomyces lasalocidi]